MEIIPAIIGKNFKEIKEKTDSVKDLARWVQIDVMDGIFVPEKSWPFSAGKIGEMESADYIRNDDLKIEIHAMVKDPEKYLDDWIYFGVDRVIVHYEATKNITEISRRLEENEIQFGVALKMETPIDVISEHIDISDIDVIQIMSIQEIGAYGMEFDKGSIAKIKRLREIYPGIEINVDGGVNFENAEDLFRAGADNLVIGSAIFKNDDPAFALQGFLDLIK